MKQNPRSLVIIEVGRRQNSATPRNRAGQEMKRDEAVDFCNLQDSIDQQFRAARTIPTVPYLSLTRRTEPVSVATWP